MSAATLRAAATKLREAATVASDGDWTTAGRTRQIVIPTKFSSLSLAGCNCADDATYIALADPVFGLAVADWLDDMAESVDLLTTKAIPASAWSMIWQTSHDRALAVARSIVGGDE